MQTKIKEWLNAGPAQKHKSKDNSTRTCSGRGKETTRTKVRKNG